MRERGSCRKFYTADSPYKIRACIITKQSDATLLPQFGCFDHVIIQLKLEPVNEIERDVIMGSVHMLHDSRDLPIQEECVRLLAYVNNK
jgi:hypothetical protein